MVSEMADEMEGAPNVRLRFTIVRSVNSSPIRTIPRVREAATQLYSVGIFDHLSVPAERQRNSAARPLAARGSDGTDRRSAPSPDPISCKEMQECF